MGERWSQVSGPDPQLEIRWVGIQDVLVLPPRDMLSDEVEPRQIIDICLAVRRK